MKMKMKIDTKARVRILMGLGVLGLSPATAGTSKVEVRWNELSPLILGHTVSLVLPGGATIAGEVEAVPIEDGIRCNQQPPQDDGCGSPALSPVLNKAQFRMPAEVPLRAVAVCQQ